jgi:hypothetical protein
VRMTISPCAQLYDKMAGCNRVGTSDGARRVAANVAKLAELGQT